MKKLITTVLILIMLASLCSCKLQEHTYVISNNSCVCMFGITPEEMEAEKDDSPWVGDNYVSMEVDEEGNLVLVLNDKHIWHWKRYIEEELKIMREVYKKAGVEYGFIISEDYTELTYMTDRSFYFGSFVKLGFLIPDCSIMQMLNGTDPNEWYVDITVKDVETGITIKTGRFSNEESSFGLNAEDWDKALGPEEQENS